jgi:copper chaperone CopZ
MSNECSGDNKTSNKEDDHGKQTISVPNITCGHCVMAIKKELTAMKGISSVKGDPGNKTITDEFDAPATIGMI